jgi:tetratricopeptide (TPR) repeat protein
LILLAVLLVAPPAPADPARAAALFDEANAAFLVSDAARAIASYEALVTEGVRSRELETNLGAAYFRKGQRGLAALHLERALVLDPADDDARQDLAEVRRENVDKLQGDADEGEALSRILAALPGRAAAIAFVASWTVGWALFAVRLVRPAAATVPAALVALSCAAIAAGIAAGAAAWERIAARRAVVVAASAPAREGPGPQTAIRFEVHEGTAVRVEDEERGFRRIKLANGLTGWVPAGAVELVVASESVQPSG